MDDQRLDLISMIDHLLNQCQEDTQSFSLPCSSATNTSLQICQPYPKLPELKTGDLWRYPISAQTMLQGVLSVDATVWTRRMQDAAQRFSSLNNHSYEERSYCVLLKEFERC